MLSLAKISMWQRNMLVNIENLLTPTKNLSTFTKNVIADLSKTKTLLAFQLHFIKDVYLMWQRNTLVNIENLSSPTKT